LSVDSLWERTTVMSMATSWFDVDRKGLRQLMDGKPKSFIIRELVQNAWDEPGVGLCIITIKHAGHGLVQLEVKDDAPEGFANISHAYTLFAETRKRKDPTKRGRFNLGEKQVLSLCKEATIKTTTGTVVFCEDGTRKKTREKTGNGSIFTALIRMNQKDMEECVMSLKAFLPPKDIFTSINGNQVKPREPMKAIEAKLTTEYTKDDGWHRTKRNTVIEVHQVKFGEKPALYEMGIPVVELQAGDKYHYNVNQRVPLNQDRDNVSPAYLRDLRGEVINVVAPLLTQEEASEGWVSQAIETDRIQKDAFTTVLHKKYGKAASFSVHDLEANHAAVAAGYTILHGGAMSKASWDNARRFEAIAPAHSVAPTSYAKFSANGEKVDMPEEKWTPAMHQVVKYVEDLGRELIGGVVVRVVKSKQGFAACYGEREVTLNYNRLGKSWFESFPENREDVTALAIHEFAHEYSGNHLDMKYVNAVATLAGKVAELALNSPKLFKPRRKK